MGFVCLLVLGFFVWERGLVLFVCFVGLFVGFEGFSLVWFWFFFNYLSVVQQRIPMMHTGTCTLLFHTFTQYHPIGAGWANKSD